MPQVNHRAANVIVNMRESREGLPLGWAWLHGSLVIYSLPAGAWGAIMSIMRWRTRKQHAQQCPTRCPLLQRARTASAPWQLLVVKHR